MATGISLANKCQLLFGAAVVAILAGSLAVPWVHTRTVIEQGQREAAREIARAALTPENFQAWTSRGVVDGELEPSPIPVRLIRLDPPPPAAIDEVIRPAVQLFESAPSASEYMAEAKVGDERVLRFVLPIRQRQWDALAAGRVPDPAAGQPEGSADPLVAVAVVERGSEFAAGQVLLSRVYLVATGVVAGLLAMLVFHLILTRLILAPVRRLRDTAEKVERGDVAVRARISTGDDFEQLGNAFDTMLDRLQQGQERLRTMNESLDLKVSQLSQANIGLFESNRLKSEFLANVSHELRTPLNSIIGFAELLEELARRDADADPKRLRYISNILSGGRTLLDMINELLSMAKLEAGRMEVGLEAVSVSDLVEGLQAIMRPQAEAKGITIVTRAAANLPTVETDPGKLQQILYNFLSNAIKFSPAGETVTISADRVVRDDASSGVRISVTDRGPGIPYDQQETIFRRFRQLDGSHTKTHGGTGLGLAICRELGDLLGATVSVVSEPGRGATFSVDLPLAYRAKELQPLMG